MTIEQLRILETEILRLIDIRHECEQWIIWQHPSINRAYLDRAVQVNNTINYLEDLYRRNNNGHDRSFF